MKKLFLALLVFVLIALVVLQVGRQPEPFPENSASERRAESGPFEFTYREETFVDHSRPTPANRDYPGDQKRTLKGGVWQPVDKSAGARPLIVYSHGYSSFHQGGKYIAEHLASLGYIVVAVDYPLSSQNAPGGPSVNDVTNQPGDVSFIIDSLVSQSAIADHPLHGMLDATRIGVTGISMGGLTSTLAAFHPEKRDHRIGAALSIAGPMDMFSPMFFTFTQVPFLMLAASGDGFIYHDVHALGVPEIIQGAELITIEKGTHIGFMDPAKPMRWINNPDALGCYLVRDKIESNNWYSLLGSPEQGIIPSSDNMACQQDLSAKALNPLRQHMITKAVVGSFFQSHFADEPAERKSAREYLSKTLSEEIEEVRYRGPSTMELD